MASEKQDRENNNGGGKNVQPERPKGSLRDILAVIPPATSLKTRSKIIKEKRIRLKYDSRLPREKARINPKLAQTLGITDKLEIVVARRHRFIFNVIIDEEADEDHVLVNPVLMEEHGVADESIATVRSYKGSEEVGVRLSV